MQVSEAIFKFFAFSMAFSTLCHFLQETQNFAGKYLDSSVLIQMYKNIMSMKHNCAQDILNCNYVIVIITLNDESSDFF